MKIASLNAWGGQVWPALGAWVETEAPDVLCCQEVIQAVGPSPEWLVYKDPYRALNQRADLFADISARLPGHTAEFTPAVQGPLHDLAGAERMTLHGLGQWVAPACDVLARVDGFVHGSFRPDGWGEEPVPRAFLAVKLRAADAGDITVAHFHGLRHPDGKGDLPARRQQAERALDLLSQITSPQERVVLGGDFNVLPDSETLEILKGWGLRDLVGQADTRTSLYPKPVRHANYMLVSDSVDVKAFDTPAEPVVSDHRPLILTL